MFKYQYSEKVTQQLHGYEDIKSAELWQMNLSFAVIKNLTATWLVDMAKYLIWNQTIWNFNINSDN
jgi:hypothetical protein